MTFDNLPLNTAISEVGLGQGILSDTGTSQDRVSVQAGRKGLRGNVAVVTGTNPALIISKNGRSGTSFPQGGTINLDFNAFEDGLVELTSLRVSGATNSRGSVSAYRDGVRLTSVAIPNTGASGSRVLELGVSDTDQLRVVLAGPGKVDDIVFND